MSALKIALVQMACNEEPADNLARALEWVARASRLGAKLVVLPELFLSPYFCQRPDDRDAFTRAETIPGPSSDALSESARKNQVVLVGGSIFERTPEGKFYNTALVYEADGQLLGTYRKMHIPEDMLYHEQHYFTPGNTGIRVFATSVGRIAPLICYDQWYPEAARIATLQGAQILVYPTAIGVIDEEVEQNITGDWELMWRSAQVGHAAVNNVIVAAVNRVGQEGAIRFWGGSFLADASAKVVAKADDKEQILFAECDPSRVASLQAAWRFLPNRRPSEYHKLTESASS
jgi:N-carbamoylputrescine amidase